MEIIDALAKYWHVVAAIVALIFTFGKLYNKIGLIEAMIIPKSEMKDKIREEVIAQLANHCPFNRDINELQNWKKTHTEWGIKTQSETHESLQEIKINLKMVCKSLGIDYQSGNGN